MATTLTDRHSQPAAAHSGDAAAPRARRWWILGVLALAQLMVVLDATVINIALPSAQHALGFTTADRQWVVTAYSLAFGSLLLFGGRLSDLLGRRRVLIVAMVGFAAASAVGGAATGFEMLVAARALQGAFAAALAPATLSLLTTTFADSKDRGKAFGIYAAIGGTGAAIGLILGGALTQYLDWRWCLYVNDAMVIPALLGAVFLLPRSGRDSRVHLDWTGTVTVVAALVAVVYGFSEAATRGWANPVTLSLLLAGAALLTVFVAIERWVAHPLLPLRIIADRNRGAANLAFLISGIGMFGVFLFLTYYLQLVLGFSPVTAGLSYLPMIGGLVVASLLATTVLLPRFGPRWVVAAGMALAAGGLVVLAQLGVGSAYLNGVVPGLIIAGVGLGLVFGVAMNVATYRAASRDAGVASALVNVGQQVGGSIGTALLNTLAAAATTTYLHSHGPTQLAAASVHGDDLGFAVAAGVFAIGAVVSAFLFERGRLGRRPDDEHAPTIL